MRRALPLALCLSLAACERAVPAIGDVAADRTPWASLDETAMRQIAQMSLDDLVRLSAGNPAATTVAATTATTESE